METADGREKGMCLQAGIRAADGSGGHGQPGVPSHAEKHIPFSLPSAVSMSGKMCIRDSDMHSGKLCRMTKMKFYLAPMEGLTGFVFRNAYQKHFGNIDTYFTPVSYTHLDVYKRQAYMQLL